MRVTSVAKKSKRFTKPHYDPPIYSVVPCGKHSKEHCRRTCQRHSGLPSPAFSFAKKPAIWVPSDVACQDIKCGDPHLSNTMYGAFASFRRERSAGGRIACWKIR